MSQSLRGDQVFLGRSVPKRGCILLGGLNPSVVIRSFWGKPLTKESKFSRWSLNPSVVIRSFWGA